MEKDAASVECRGVETDKPLAQQGYDLMAAVFEVHRELGGGLSEEIYQQSLEIELGLRNLPSHSKKELAVYYKGRRIVKAYFPDLLVCERILVELKSVKELAAEHEAQLINYMRITRLPVGYLVNFGPTTKVQWKRFVLSEYLKSENLENSDHP
ncbi:MAG TPA: GxxExxY protein [Pirellulales bacterium]|jgi:GxxExxY protein